MVNSPVQAFAQGRPSQSQPKSDAARAAALQALMDAEARPFGTAPEDRKFQAPANYVPPPARIYMRNWSRTQSYKRIWIPVSFRRGAEEALTQDKKLAEIYNVDTLFKRVADGFDMTRYKTEVHPVAFRFKVDNEVWTIPPAKDAQSEPPKVEVPEGAWDLFLGNYERMHAVDRHTGAPNAAVIGEEKTRLAFSWRNRHNPVLKYTDDGESNDIKNEFGFIEFIREPIRPMAEVQDKEYLTALELCEV